MNASRQCMRCESAGVTVSGLSAGSSEASWQLPGRVFEGTHILISIQYLKTKMLIHEIRIKPMTTHTHTHTCTHTCTHTRTHTCTHTCKHTCTNTQTHTQTHKQNQNIEQALFGHQKNNLGKNGKWEI